MEKEELLEQLRINTGCAAISDLKFLNRHILYAAIKKISYSDFCKTEWQDAVMYLTGHSVDKNVKIASLKDYLCNYYAD